MGFLDEFKRLAHPYDCLLYTSRDPGEITLCAATKVQTDDTIREAIAAGITVCGENRVQELTAHLEANAYEGAQVHFIGHLQTNKVNKVVGKVDLIHSVDSERLLRAIDRQADKMCIRDSSTTAGTPCRASTGSCARALSTALTGTPPALLSRPKTTAPIWLWPPSFRTTPWPGCTRRSRWAASKRTAAR